MYVFYTDFRQDLASSSKNDFGLLSVQNISIFFIYALKHSKDHKNVNI